MRLLGLMMFIAFSLSYAVAAGEDVSIRESANGWILTNSLLTMRLSISPENVKLESLRLNGGEEWSVAGTPFNAAVEGLTGHFRYVGSELGRGPRGGQQLLLKFRSETGVLLSHILRMYPRVAVIESVAVLENMTQQPLRGITAVDPIALTLRAPKGALTPLSSDRRFAGFYPQSHGFRPVGDLSGSRRFEDWVVFQDLSAQESILVGGDLAANVLPWVVRTTGIPTRINLRAGNPPPLIVFKDNEDTNKKDGHLDAEVQKDNAKVQAFIEVLPNEKVITPISFIAFAKGDSDDVGNTAFRYLKRHVLLKPVPNAPLVGYSVWLTEDHTEEILREEISFAKRAGFEVLYLDASWYENSSMEPGMNDWSKGLGIYKESKEKFPSGIKNFSDAVRSTGMKFGLWVDPPNVDSARVKSGEIPESWLALVDGQQVGSTHPSLSPTRQLSLANHEVIAWLKKELSGVIEKWNVEWLKWDPSATVTTATDRGNRRRSGSYVEYAGRMEIMKYLTDRFPQLNAFEMPPTLLYSRLNPGPRGLLPGGYTNELIHGPMTSPNVWGALDAAGFGEAGASSALTGRWYSASYLDYDLRRHFTHGVIYSNHNAMSAQLFSRAPSGYVIAFKRAARNFKLYRHLLFEDVFHPRLSNVKDWSAIEYVKDDGSEAVAFVFRDGAETETNVVYFRGLDPTTSYRVTSLNRRPGREQIIQGDKLMSNGLEVRLPDPWLALGDRGSPESLDAEFKAQLRYGSDIIMLRKL